MKTSRSSVKRANRKPMELIDQGKHGFAALKRVPVFRMKVSEGLWLTNKAALLQLEHFNKSNALSWALAMGLFATPVIYSDREWSQMVGESYYIQMGPQDRFGWTEPEGKVYQIAAGQPGQAQGRDLPRVLPDDAGRLEFGLGASIRLGQAVGFLDYGGSTAGLRRHGEGCRATDLERYRSGAPGREHDRRRGPGRLRHRRFRNDLQDAKNLLALGIQSPTLTKQVFKTMAL